MAHFPGGGGDCGVLMCGRPEDEDTLVVRDFEEAYGLLSSGQMPSGMQGLRAVRMCAQCETLGQRMLGVWREMDRWRLGLEEWAAPGDVYRRGWRTAAGAASGIIRGGAGNGRLLLE